MGKNIVFPNMDAHFEYARHRHEIGKIEFEHEVLNKAKEPEEPPAEDTVKEPTEKKKTPRGKGGAKNG